MILLLHPGELFYGLGLTLLVCLLILFILSVLGARANRSAGGRKLPKIDGVNRAQRRKDRAWSRQKKRY